MTHPRSRLLAALVVACGLFHAASASAQETRLADPSLSLGAPAARHDPRFELANRSLIGPRFEMAGGVILTVSGPFVAALWIMTDGLGNLFECLPTSGDDGRACEERREAREQRVARRAYVTMGMLSLTGIGLIAHGAYQARHIRVARRAIELEDAQVGVTAQGAQATLRFRF